ncbi:HprK-related kinase A [Allosphingosinicella deserti]|uniref:HprK-related kinase A n=1 Tax=Allosphingosinicella deserti TaxID=2116704 RepID=A0A2P7QZM5_9SPHN|nr:HprK-related kinase A [Sphingomonas deserti]PSJ43403.1 HprK-related kinase A [Sphingomonas deserti]
MRHALALKIGPVSFRIGSAWREPLAQLERLYAGYPAADEVADFTVRLEPATPWRRFARPSVAIRGDYTLPDAAPLPLPLGLLAAEMGMNLQMALGQKRYLLLHAGIVARDGEALILTGASGAGKSTLAALLGEQGWRFMGDEFGLLDPETGFLHPFPRAISLKNAALALFDGADPGRLGPVLRGTPKGMIRHLRPPADAIARMAEPARPALILFPRYGRDFPAEDRPVGAAEVFVRLTQASTNYVSLGARGFDALTALVAEVPARAIDYGSSAEAIAMVERLWAARA